MLWAKQIYSAKSDKTMVNNVIIDMEYNSLFASLQSHGGLLKFDLSTGELLNLKVFLFNGNYVSDTVEVTNLFYVSIM